MGKIKFYIALILVLLFSVIGGGLYAFNKLGVFDAKQEEVIEEEKGFGVEYNGVELSSVSYIDFLGAQDHVFKVNGGKAYSVKVVPSDKATWTYYVLKNVNGEVQKLEYSFMAQDDLTSAFNVDCYSDYFIFSFDIGLTIQEVLETLHPGEVIELTDGALLSEYNYALQISAKGEDPILINFKCTSAGVVLDKDEITFLG